MRKEVDLYQLNIDIEEAYERLGQAIKDGIPRWIEGARYKYTYLLSVRDKETNHVL